MQPSGVWAVCPFARRAVDSPQRIVVRTPSVPPLRDVHHVSRGSTFLAVVDANSCRDAACASEKNAASSITNAWSEGDGNNKNAEARRMRRRAEWRCVPWAIFSGITMRQSDHGSYSELMNYVVRMVVPMRREFGHPLDVRHFLHDSEYAREVIQQALTSRDARLLQYATYVAEHHLGPRNGPNLPPSGEAAAVEKSAAQQSPSETVEVPLSANPTAQEMRERVLRKYASRLR
jgi:hypothetical protein